MRGTLAANRVSTGARRQAVEDSDPPRVGDMMGTILYRLPAYNLCLRGEIASCLLTVSISEGLILQVPMPSPGTLSTVLARHVAPPCGFQPPRMLRL